MYFILLTLLLYTWMGMETATASPSRSHSQTAAEWTSIWTQQLQHTLATHYYHNEQTQATSVKKKDWIDFPSLPRVEYESRYIATSGLHDPVSKTGFGPETVNNVIGYISVNGSYPGIYRHLWYWMFESRRDPTTDPLVIWSVNQIQI